MLFLDGAYVEHPDGSLRFPNASVIDRNAEGLVILSYDVVHVDFELKAA